METTYFKKKKKKIETARSITLKLESVTIIDIHGCGDSNILGSCAAAYATFY